MAEGDAEPLSDEMLIEAARLVLPDNVAMLPRLDYLINDLADALERTRSQLVEAERERDEMTEDRDRHRFEESRLRGLVWDWGLDHPVDSEERGNASDALFNSPLTALEERLNAAEQSCAAAESEVASLKEERETARRNAKNATDSKNRMLTQRDDARSAVVVAESEVASLRQVVTDLLKWIDRYRGADPTLDPEEYYIETEQAKRVIDALTSTDETKEPENERYDKI